MRIELNLTLRCNAKCPNCNRCCDLYPERTDDVSFSQFADMVREVRATPSEVTRIKVVGGEPLLHPDFESVCDALSGLVAGGYVGKVKIDTNGILEVLPRYRKPHISFSGTKPKKKVHLPYLWSPTDLKLPIKPCSQPRFCGLSLDNIGWLPCSPAIMIVRAFRLKHLYKYEMPTETWGLDEICKHCIHAAPAAWRKEHERALCDITEEEKTPSPSWKEGLERYKSVYCG